MGFVLDLAVVVVLFVVAPCEYESLIAEFLFEFPARWLPPPFYEIAFVTTLW